MNLDKAVASLVEAQNNHDSEAYVACFSETAIVHDEGKTHKGKTEIVAWIEKANREYQAILKPLKYEETAVENLLTAEVSGNFPGSPTVLQFHLKLKEGLIDSLNISA